MSRQKDMFLVVDTETANSVEEPLPYDIGYAICDRTGRIYRERSFVVAEIFLDMQDVMQSAYYAEKIPKYWEDIKNGKRIIKSIYNIRKQIIEDMKTYNVKYVSAYNMGFDKKALNNLVRYTTKSFVRWFFPCGTKYICIWNLCCNTLLNTKTYINFAKKNNLVSEKDNILTSAESAYKYLTKNLDFSESHTGLEDVKIEIALMTKCFETHKKLYKDINPNCWRVVQKKRKEMESEKVFA